MERGSRSRPAAPVRSDVRARSTSTPTPSLAAGSPRSSSRPTAHKNLHRCSTATPPSPRSTTLNRIAGAAPPHHHGRGHRPATRRRSARCSPRCGRRSARRTSCRRAYGSYRRGRPPTTRTTNRFRTMASQASPTRRRSRPLRIASTCSPRCCPSPTSSSSSRTSCCRAPSSSASAAPAARSAASSTARPPSATSASSARRLAPSTAAGCSRTSCAASGTWRRPRTRRAGGLGSCAAASSPTTPGWARPSPCWRSW